MNEEERKYRKKEVYNLGKRKKTEEQKKILKQRAEKRVDSGLFGVEEVCTITRHVLKRHIFE